jgi:serine/threonine protein kinase
VATLLEAHALTSGLLEQTVAPLRESMLALNMPLAEKIGDRIGRHKLLQQIGEGGCGVVYMAEQQEPVKRLVALKVVKPGMDTRKVLARFDAERQALALMDHPNIAKVLDAGATDTGRPFFVLELVRGVKITDYCDDPHNGLPTQQRLELFIQVCSAIQHAHQKGIIHRDIKPSNVLVTSQQDAVVSSEFSPDGKRALVASRNGTVCVWDIRTAQALALPLTHGVGEGQLDFDPDGRLRVGNFTRATSKLVPAIMPYDKVK